MIFPADLTQFADPLRRRIKRLNPIAETTLTQNIRTQDQLMHDEEEKKEF